MLTPAVGLTESDFNASVAGPGEIGVMEGADPGHHGYSSAAKALHVQSVANNVQLGRNLG